MAGLVRRFFVFRSADPNHDGLLRALVEPLSTAPDRAEELVQIRLERREHLVDPVLGFQLLLAGLAAGIVDDLLRLALGELDDLGLRRLTRRLLAGLAEDAVALALRLGQHLLPLLDDPARLLDLLGDGGAHLVEDVVDLLAVDSHLIRKGNGLRVVDEIVQLVDEYENVHWKRVYWPDRLLLRVDGRTGTTAGEQLGEPGCDVGGNELVHLSPEGGDLLHAARGDEAVLRARRLAPASGSDGSSGTPTRSRRSRASP